MPKLKRIRLITPVTQDVSERMVDLESLQHPGELEISRTGIAFGPPSVECEYDEALAAPYIVARAQEARDEGVDAVVIDCMSDPGLRAARELLDIPVFGPRETCMHVATMLGHRFSYIGIKNRNRARIERAAATYGVLDHLASVRAVDLDVVEVTGPTGQHRLHERIIEESLIAAQNDRADVLLIGCTAFFGCEVIVGQALEQHGLSIPVINPIRTTVAYAASLLDLGLSHSKKAYPAPPIRPRTGYPFKDGSPIPGVSAR
ncbi:aspartate/glutamate racemase family protein [Sphingomonas crocodyli]|uniref:Hydrogenase expression protein HupH n=1 Tax=Sphingomonas crocodyli TaxID=1979270 RepID=A0A437M5H9_9SPHN|nr:aspartate/glutamate racemase family protein [Sphingomonas crocodyli]RVT92980.1 hydrogenase expression protein HupH [Sphingomonas crocodyli]